MSRSHPGVGFVYNSLSNDSGPREIATSQQAIYNNSISDNTLRIHPASKKPGKVKPGAGIAGWIAHRWELAGVLTLMGSSAACAALSLAHLGL